MGNFWADKLSGHTPPPTPPAYAQTAWWDTERPRPIEDVESREFPSHRPPAPQQAASQRNAGLCPECGSGNYMPQGRNAPYRCFDCNYPLTQEFSGATTGPGTPHGKPVRQVTGSGWHPDVIVGRVE